VAADPRHIPVLGACSWFQEGTTGIRRGRVGVISPAPFLVTVQRGELAGSPARPASRRTRVVKPPLGCAPPCPGPKASPRHLLRRPHRHPASSKEEPRDCGPRASVAQA
jgi:hypothetical protein